MAKMTRLRLLGLENRGIGRTLQRTAQKQRVRRRRLPVDVLWSRVQLASVLGQPGLDRE